MSKSTEATKNDLDQKDDEEENWDDWGDAEDFPSSPPKAAIAAASAQEKIVSTRNAVQQPKRDDDETKKLPSPQEQHKHNVMKGKSTSVTAAATTTTNDINCTNAKAALTEHDYTEARSTWGGSIWGVLSKASEGLGNITNTVSQGLNQVIGVPDPEEMARFNAEEEKQKPATTTTTTTTAAAANEHSTSHNDEDNQRPTEDASPGEQAVFGLNLVSGVTSLGSKVLNTGLDTLEGIGKKTMTMLQENDPLLMNKRKLLRLEQERPNLSEVLQEAKKDADHLENQLKELQLEKTKEQLRFDALFENHCGLVHLEALEILSRESKLKLDTLQESVSGNALTELHETINEVRELMELEDLEGHESEGDYVAEQLQQLLAAAIADAELQINFDDVVANWTDTLKWLADEGVSGGDDATTPIAAMDEQVIYAQAINALSASCALQVSKLHKIAELLLVKEHHSTANEVDAIVQLCTQFTIHLHGQTNRYAAVLSAKATPEAKLSVNTLFAEMLAATQHIEKAFQLFLPILQIGAV